MSDLRVDLESALFSRRDRKASRSNGRIRFRCPRHDDRNPSAWMGDAAWGCMACGFTEPLASLAEILGVAVPLRGYTLEEYADDKLFPIGKLQAFGLSTAQQNGRSVVAIPYFAPDGSVLRRRFRAGGKKWWEGKNRPIYLYGAERLTDLAPGSPLLIVEGESDCHAAWLHGFDAVGVPGATTWKPEWAEIVRGFDLYVWEEPDQGGPQLVASVARDFPDAKVIQDAPTKDLADLHKQRGKDFPAAVRSLMASAMKIGTPKPPVAYDALLGERIDALLRYKLRPVDAVPTPFEGWNAACAGEGGRVGLARGWHVVAAAKTGTGKSILALNLAARAVRAGERVCFISLEMSQPEVETRFLAILSGVHVRKLEQGRDLDPSAFRDAGAWVNRVHQETGGTFYCNREPIHTLEDVDSSIRYNAEVYGARYFVVDYMQLAGNAMDPESIARVSSVVRQCAKDLRVVTVGLSQFNRTTSASKERPQKEGLMGGSPLENDADQILLLDHSRLERDAPDRNGWVTYALLDKNRHGPCTEIPIRFDGNTLRMEERPLSEFPSIEVR